MIHLLLLAGEASLASRCVKKLVMLGVGVLPGIAGAQAQTISISPSALNFGVQSVGVPNPQNFNISNTGNQAVTINSFAVVGTNAGDFSVSFNTCGISLAAGQNCFVQVNFTPAALGPRSAEVTISDGASGSPQTVTLSGTGGPPVIAVQFLPSSVKFGTVNIGNYNSNQSVEVSNAGNANVTFSSFSISGTNASDFALLSNNCGSTLFVDEGCNLSISFSPKSLGTKSAVLTVTDNANGSPQNIPLKGTGVAPTTSLAISPSASYNFGAQNLHSASTYGFMVSNTGTTAVAFSSISITGANTSDFVITSNGCGNPFPVGYPCYVSVAFIPTAIGARSATLNFVDNASGSPQTVALSGTGQTATTLLTISPAAVAFGGVSLTVPIIQPVYLTNSGTTPVNLQSFSIGGANAGDFSIGVNFCQASLGAGSECYVYLNFIPSATGARSATLNITDNVTGSPQTIALNGTGLPAVSLTFNPGAINFGTIKPGTSASQTLTITNPSNAPVYFEQTLFAGESDFAVTATNCPGDEAFLNGNSSCSLTISFTPSEGGPRSANLAFQDNAAHSPQVIFLGGAGAQPTRTLAFYPLLTGFGNQNVGSSSAALQINVTNTGNSPVNFNSVAINGANATDFAISANTCTEYPTPLLEGSECGISVIFTPTASGPRQASLTLTSNAGGSPQSLTLVGNGLTPSAGASISPLEINFGGELIGVTSGSQEIQVQSTGTELLAVSSVAISGANAGDFTISVNGCSFTTLGYAGCYVYVTFTPTAAGMRTATLTIQDNAAGSPQSVLLTGTGQASGKTLTPNFAVLPFGAVAVGMSTSTPFLNLTNNGTAAVNFQSITVSGANAADFTINDNSCALNNGNLLQPGGVSCSVSVTFTPSGAGPRTADLTVVSDAGGSPLVVPINGVGVSGGQTLSITPATLSFSQPVGVASAPQTIFLQNTGAEPLTLSNIAITGAGDYAIVNNYCAGILYVGFTDSCSLEVVYTPSTAGRSTASLGISSTSGNHAVLLSGVGQTPSTALSVPASITFNAQGVGLKSLAQGVKITNSGSLPVTLNNFAISGTNAGDFAIDANSCGANLAAATSCTVGVTFTPSATGARTGKLIITDNVPGSPQSIALSGTGEASQKMLTTSATAVAFGSIVLGTTAVESLTVTNAANTSVTIASYAVNGSNAGEFAVSQNTCSSLDGNIIPAGASCKIFLTFAPAAIGVRCAALAITSDASGSPLIVQLNGSAQSVALTLVINPVTLDFGGTNLGAKNVQVFQLTNTGDAAVTTGSYAVAGANPGDFAISGNGCAKTVIAPQASCPVSVTFTPTATGARSAFFSISDNAAGGEQSIAFAGLGQTTTKTLSLAQNTYDFGVSNVGSALQSSPLTALNTGTASVTFTSYGISGVNASDFSITNNSCLSASANVLPAGESSSCALILTFKPSAAGPRTATLLLVDDAGGSPQAIGLVGVGQNVTKSVALSKTTYDLGVSPLGTAASGTIRISNTGSGNVTFSKFAITGSNAGEFAVSTNNCAAPISNVLTAGSECSVILAFTPAATGIRTATLAISDDAGGSPQNIALTGEGESATKSLQISAPTLLFTSAIGTQSVKYVYFNNVGTDVVQFTNAGIAGPNAADFAITYNYCQVFSPGSNGLPVGGNCYIAIGFTPTLVGNETATLSVTDGASAKPETISLTGLGQGLQKTLVANTDFELFQGVPVGGTGQVFDGLTAAGTGAVTLSGLTLSGTNAAEFTLNTATSSCLAGAIVTQTGCQAVIDFAPLAPGFRTATLQIADNGSGGIQNVLLQGFASVAGASLGASSPAFFSSTPLNQTNTVPSYIWFQNLSAGTLTLKPATLVGTNAADFSIQSSGCGTTLLANAQCFVSVSFTPTGVGPRTAAVEISYTGGTGTVVDALVGGDGAGGAGYLVVNPIGLEFDATVIDATSNAGYFTLRNAGTGPISSLQYTFTGANAGDFSISSYPFGFGGCATVVMAGTSCTLGVEFRPTGSGLRTATLQIQGDAPNMPQSVSLVGVGETAREVLYASTASLDLGTQNINGGSTSAQVSLGSRGNSNITLENFQITGPNAAAFSIVNSYCQSMVSYDCQITIGFAPTVLGPQTANLLITSDAPGSPLTIPLSGVGQAETAALSVSQANIDFGLANISAQTTSTIAITNQGDAAVNFSLPLINGANPADFVIASNNCAALPANASCYMTLAFTPSGTGERTAALNINDDAGGSPQTVGLFGTGQMISHLLSASAVTIDFGAQNVGALSNSTAVQITNTGASPAAINGMTISGKNAADFIMDAPGPGGCGASLAAGAACAISIQFQPSLTGPETATLTITSDSAAGPILVSLLGVGQNALARLNASVSTLDLGVQTIGSGSATGSFTLTNNGDTTVTLYQPSISGANAANFVITQGSCFYAVLSPGATCSFTLAFTPSITGLATAGLQISSTASATPLTVSLTGTGTLP